MRCAARSLLIGLAVTTLAYASLVLAIGRFYKRILYPAPRATRLHVPEAAQLWALRAADSVAVNAVDFPVPNPRRTIVYFHGNGETVEDNFRRAATFVSRGFRFVLVEYRGYGVSPLVPITEEGLYLDSLAVLDTLGAHGVRASDIALWGTSLGTGIATEMARLGRGNTLILVSPYTSITEMVALRAPFLPTKFLVAEKFDTLAKAPSLPLPVLVIHGEEDEVIPFSMGERVALAFPNAYFHRVPRGHHNDLFSIDGPRLIDEIAALAAR